MISQTYLRRESEKDLLSLDRYSLLAAAILLGMPKPAAAYVDPGSGTMLWQMAAAAVIGSLFYVRRGFTWVRERLGLKTGTAGTAPAKGSRQAETPREAVNS